MKAKELMIGDWVNFYHSPLSQNGIYYSKIIVLDKYDVECNPIQLTSEILEANGWYTPKYHGGFSSQYETREGDICITINVISHCLDIRIYDTNYDMPIPVYVHELQHALRLCGLNELADNFKI